MSSFVLSCEFLSPPIIHTPAFSFKKSDLLTLRKNRTTQLFEQAPFLLTIRGFPFWIVSGLSTVLWGHWSMRFRTIRTPLSVGFLIYPAGLIGLATIQPWDDLISLISAGLAGLAFGPLALIITGVQLSTLHHLIATATAVTRSARAVGATVFTAIYSTVFSSPLVFKLPASIGSAVLKAGSGG